MTAPIRSRNDFNDYTAFDPDHDLACLEEKPRTAYGSPSSSYDDTLGLPTRLGVCSDEAHLGAERFEFAHDGLDLSCHETEGDPCALATSRNDATSTTSETSVATQSANEDGKLVWGAKVSPAFKDKVIAVSQRLGCDPNDLMACMAFETGGGQRKQAFDPKVENRMSHAVGLIQFMPPTAARLHTSVPELKGMTPERQLDYVEKYLAQYKGKLSTLEDLYMAILWPDACGKDTDHVLFRENDPEHPAFYAQNAGLDANRDGVVTKFEAAAAVRAQRAAGEKFAR